MDDPYAIFREKLAAGIVTIHPKSQEIPNNPTPKATTFFTNVQRTKIGGVMPTERRIQPRSEESAHRHPPAKAAVQ